MDTVAIYPNPTTGQIQILSSTNSVLEIRNALGQEIQRLKIENQFTKLDLTKFSNGMYHILGRKDGKLMHQEKIVKK